MPDTISDSVANIIVALIRGQSPRISAKELRLLSRVAAANHQATFVLGGITAVLAANEAIKRIPHDVPPIVPEPGLGPVGPIFPEYEGPEPISPGPYPPDSPQPISPGPYPPDAPQPIEPGPPDNPEGPQPTDPDRPWFEQLVRYVVLEEFLVPAELETISRFALDSEKKFQPSQVVVPGATSGRVDFQSRRSKVLTNLGNLADMLRERIRGALPLVGQRLGIDARKVKGIDIQMTASNDQEFFVAHTDKGAAFPTRAISYVYFFNREPAAFTGGELKLYHKTAVGAAGSPPSRFTVITPAQNQIVFFPSSLMHEVSPVSVPSKAFADSRFTVNGWIHV
jgi:hypothetical protein